MRAIFLTQWFDPEPGAIRGLPLAAWLTRHSYAIKVLTGFPNYPGGKVYAGYRIRWRERQILQGIPVLRVALYPSHDSSALRRVANYASFALSAATVGTALIGGAEVAYVYHPPATVGFPALALKTFRRVPFVYHIADMWPQSVVESGMVGDGFIKKLIGGGLSSWCRLLYRRAAALTVLSPGFKRMLVDAGVPGERVHVIYNWAEENAFRPLPPDLALGDQLGFRGRFNIVYAGNMGPFQGLETVIRAAAMLEREPDIQIVMVGTGQKEAELRKLAAEVGATNVRFLGFRPYTEMPRINSLADILLIHLKDLPFFAATIPGKTQISLASGRPVLMAVRGDAADLLSQAGAGVVCEPENPAAMARAMLEMFQMPRQRLEEMGARGHAYYLSHLSLDVAGQKMDEIFREVVARKSERRREPARLRPEMEKTLGGPGILRRDGGARSCGESVGYGTEAAVEAGARNEAHAASRLKRATDVVVAGIALTLTLPLWIVIAVLIKLSSKGPIFFLHKRAGLHGRPFTLIKFRTMTQARDERGNLLPDASRLTRLGRFLRATSLDELPELVNVLKGEMSLVGPRPLLREYLPRYTAEQRRRHEAKPGITGWAQVNGRNALRWEQKFALDVWYVDHRSFWLDLKILFLTLLRVLSREGIRQPGHATAEEFHGTLR